MNESKVEQDTLIVQCDTNNSKKKDVKNGRPEEAPRAPWSTTSTVCSKGGGAYFQVENNVAMVLFR